MVEITVKIDGMMCSMCEAHVNDAIRRTLPVKKVSSSHETGTTTIVAEQSMPAERLEEIIATAGYRVLAVEEKPWVKKGFLYFLRK